MLRSFALFCSVMLFNLHSHAFGTGDVYRVGHVNLLCSSGKGLVLSTKNADIKSPEKTTVEAVQGKDSTTYSANLHPYFFQWTWITLSPAKNSAAANDQQQTGENKLAEDLQIYLLGNTPDEVETSLSGFIGRGYSIPTGGGWGYPVGFYPDSTINCKLYWINILK